MIADDIKIVRKIRIIKQIYLQSKTEFSGIADNDVNEYQNPQKQYMIIIDAVYKIPTYRNIKHNIVAAKKNFYHTKLKITSPITRMLKKALCGYTIT